MMSNRPRRVASHSAKRLRPLAGWTFLAVGLTSASSCGGGFDPANMVQSVRILASRADKPYAAPGEEVNVEVLAADGRTERPHPMNLYWVPLVCENPYNDAYYGCFAAFAPDGGTSSGGIDGGRGATIVLPDGGSLGVPLGDGGASELPASLLRPGIDLTPLLVAGPTFRFTMPADVVRSHPPEPGAPQPYGLVILFHIACAGHVELVAPDLSKGVQAVPFACVDSAGRPLDPEHYVIGFTRVFSYESVSNANPVIERVTFQGQPVDLTRGVTIDRCNQKPEKCPPLTFSIEVPESSWELKKGDPAPDGTERHEQIWVANFTSEGRFDGDARLLYDPVLGKVDKVEMVLRAPARDAEGNIWFVVHDNRGGAAWVTFPVLVR